MCLCFLYRIYQHRTKAYIVLRGTRQWTISFKRKAAPSRQPHIPVRKTFGETWQIIFAAAYWWSIFDHSEASSSSPLSLTKIHPDTHACGFPSAIFPTQRLVAAQYGIFHKRPNMPNLHSLMVFMPRLYRYTSIKCTKNQGAHTVMT